MKDLYLLGRDSLKESGIENPDLESALLLSKVLGTNTTYIYAHPENWVQPEKVEEVEILLQRRIKREPIAYILGEKEFYSRSFIVTPDVLIPRPETEMLVEEAFKITKSIPNPSVLDVGTGSGCIAVSLAFEDESAKIFATDIFLGALMVARANLERHKVSKRISLICADFLSCFKENSFDIIISNPPYIPEAEFFKLEPDVREFEPKVSLIGGGSAEPVGSPGEEGLNCINKIVLEAVRVLKNNGWCIIEIGANQSGKVTEIFERAGFKGVSIVKDLAGIDRVVKGQYN